MEVVRDDLFFCECVVTSLTIFLLVLGYLKCGLPSLNTLKIGQQIKLFNCPLEKPEICETFQAIQLLLKIEDDF